MTRVRALAAGLLVVLGACLLVAAAVLAAGDSAPTAVVDDAAPPAPTSSPAPSSSEAGTVRTGPGRSLERSRPRPAEPGAGAAPSSPGSPGAPAARAGRRLPPQWPDFRPTVLRLGAAASDPATSVEGVDVVGGALELPADADRVGWWRGGSRAGTPFGTLVVAGHLDTQTDPVGFLAGLTPLRPGDRVVLTAPGHEQAYRVERNYLLPSADISARSDLFEQQRPHRLLLITCGGPYDQARGRYLDNRVVEAVPVG